jgi:hypothetical protein
MESLQLPFTWKSAVSPDGSRYVEFTHTGDALVWSLDSGRFQGRLIGNGYPISSWCFGSDGRHLTTATEAGDATLWDVPSGRALGAVVSLDDGDWVVLDGERRYFFGSRRAEVKLAYRIGSDAVPFEQFDLVFNRPDLVLKQLGAAPPARIVAAEHAFEKRRTATVRAAKSAAEDPSNLPSIVLGQTPVSTTQLSVSVKIEASSTVGLSRLNVFDNESPIPGVHGRTLSGAAATFSIDVPLAVGPNELNVSVTDRAGVESLRRILRVVRLGDARPRTFVVAVGVSAYRNSRLFLTRAAQDAREVADAFRQLRGFEGPEPLVLTDADVDGDLATKISAFVRDATIDDRLVLYLAGHGTNSPNDGYRFLTQLYESPADVHFVSYQQLESLLASAKPMSKLLLLDTCFAGGDADASLLRAAPGADGDESWRYYDLLDDLVDLRRGSGAIVVAASRGSEVSYDLLPSVALKRGLFAHAVILSLTDPSADANRDGRLSVSELRDFVVHKVDDLSGGFMIPVTRSDNIRNDFTVR